MGSESNFNGNDLWSEETGGIRNMSIRESVDTPNLVIWFNNWFSSLPITLKEIKEQFNMVKIIGTSISTKCAYEPFVDEWSLEPSNVTPEEYVQWALKFCKKNKVNIFFARNYAKTISKYINSFDEIGVTVVCEEYETYQEFYSKAQIYERLRQSNFGEELIPPYSIVNTVEGFKATYRDYNTYGETVCIKFDHDEGAASFREITDSFISSRSLKEKLENKITYDNAVAIIEAMEKQHTMQDIMVMPKILSPEVSIDCYKSPNYGFIIIPRFKLGGRVKEIRMDSYLIQKCIEIHEIFNFNYAYNVQFRWSRTGYPLLLEINPRISGGIHLSSLSGVSIPNQIIADILGLSIIHSEKYPKERLITQYETPVII